MAPACIVRSCSNKRNQGKTLFTVPREESVASEWLNAVRRPDLIGSTRHLAKLLVCEDHFPSSYFREPKSEKSRKMLVVGAVPVLPSLEVDQLDLLPFDDNEFTTVEAESDNCAMMQCDVQIHLDGETMEDEYSVYSTSPAVSLIDVSDCTIINASKSQGYPTSPINATALEDDVDAMASNYEYSLFMHSYSLLHKRKCDKKRKPSGGTADDGPLRKSTGIQVDVGDRCRPSDRTSSVARIWLWVEV